MPATHSRLAATLAIVMLVISRVMIVGTPAVITRANLLATARRQAMRVAQAMPA